MKLDSTTIQRLLRIESLAVIVFATALTTYSLTTARRELPPSHVATVDLEKTYNSIQRYSDTQASLKKLAEQLDAQVGVSEASVKDLEAALKGFPRPTWQLPERAVEDSGTAKKYPIDHLYRKWEEQGRGRQA